MIGGGTPKTSVPEYWDGDIPWLSVKDFSGDKRYVYETEKCITEDGLNNSSTKYLNQNDIIVSARGTVGEMAMMFCLSDQYYGSILQENHCLVFIKNIGSILCD